MAVEWKDRIIQYPARYQLVPVAGQEGVFDFVPVTGEVTEVGTPVNASSLTDISAPVGMVATFAGNQAPTGWLKADGSIVSRTTYSKLFDYIGTLYGAGDGSTTFKLPDLRGEFIRGLDDGRGIDINRVLGTSQGGSRFKKGGWPSASYGGLSYGGTDLEQVESTSDAYPVGNSVTGSGITIGTVRPRNVALLACIKY
jgi:microcystin-dependent protein